MSIIHLLGKVKDVVKFKNEKWLIDKVWFNGETNRWLYNLVLLTKDDTFYNTENRQVEACAIPVGDVGPVLFNLTTAANMARKILSEKHRKEKWENKDKPVTLATGTNSFCCLRSEPEPWSAEDEAKFEAQKKAYFDYVSNE